MSKQDLIERKQYMQQMRSLKDQDRRTADEQVVRCLVGSAEEKQDNQSVVLFENSQCYNGE